MFMWTSISILLLFFYLLYRRRQDETDEEQTAEEPRPRRESSEYRLSAARVLPTIVEENPPTLPSSFPLSSARNHAISPLRLGQTTISIVSETISIILFFISF